MQTEHRLSSAESRWKIASDFADYVPAAYNEEFMKISAGRFDGKLKEAEKKIWKEYGMKLKIYAKELNCPLKNAKNVADAYGYITKAILGPEFETVVTEGKYDSANIITDSCPLIRIALENGLDTGRNAELCSIFAKSAIDSLNPAYRVVINSSMCNGDANCGMQVLKK